MKKIAPLLSLLLFSIQIQASENVRVLTYNAGVLNIPLLGKEIDPLANERGKNLPNAIAQIANEQLLDIIALDEVWNPDVVDGLRNALEPTFTVIFPRPHTTILGVNLPGILDPGTREPWYTGLFLAVRSSYRLNPAAGNSAFNQIPFQKKAIEDRPTTMKGLLTVNLIGPSQVPFLFVLTQLDDPLDVGYNKDAANIVDTQITQVAKAAQEVSDKGDLPILICGDMNMGVGYADQAYARFDRDFGLADVFTAVHPTSYLKSYTWDRMNPVVHFGEYPDEPQSLIDHCFIKNSETHSWMPKLAQITLKSRNKTDPAMRLHGQPVPLSDHYALQVELGLN